MSLLREGTSAQAMDEVFTLVNGSPLDNMGPKGTGTAPVWVWIVLGILVGLILIACAVGCYRKRAAANAKDDEKEGDTIGTINDAISESGLDEPLL